MIGNQSPSETLGIRIGDNPGKPIKKVVPVVVIEKDLPALDSPQNDVVQRTGGIYSGFSRHSSRL
jgi:hypothetical protein